MKKKLILIIIASVLAIAAIGLVVFVTSNNSGTPAVGLCDNGHKLVTVSSKSPTCTQYGYSEHTKCLRCDYVEGYVEVAPLGHTEEIIPAIEATCNTTGKSEGKKCSTCGTVLVPQITLGRLAHSYVTLPAVEPTCTTAGLSEGKTCSICGHIGLPQLKIPALGHTEITALERIDPTCTQSGYTAKTICSECGSTVQSRVSIPPLGHREYVSKESVSATCTQTGLTAEISCAVCNEILSEQTTIRSLGHIPSTLWGYSATCTEKGLTNGHQCSRCNQIYDVQVEIPPLGHSLIFMEGKASTCAYQGYTDYQQCTRCSYEVDKELLPLQSHEYDNIYGYNDDYHYLKCLNCSHIGTKIYHKFGVWEVHTPATNVVGKEVSTCQCGFEKFRPIPAVGEDGTVYDLTGCVFKVDPTKFSSITNFDDFDGKYNVDCRVYHNRTISGLEIRSSSSSYDIFVGNNYSCSYKRDYKRYEGLSYIEFLGGSDTCNESLIQALQSVGRVYSYRIINMSDYIYDCTGSSCFSLEITPFDYSITAQITLLGNNIYNIERIYSEYIENKYTIKFISSSGAEKSLSILNYMNVTGGADATNEALISMLMQYGYFYPKE